MRGATRYEFRVATREEDLAQIRRLTYLTFVEEIPQHAPNGEGVLVDRFHAENTYLTCRDGDAVVGMIVLRGRRPFSLDSKLPDLDTYLPPGRVPCEVRLLAVDPAHRHGRAFWGLVELLVAEGRRRGYDLALISGTLRQEKLYRNLGFVPFGPLVGTAEAPFQPMYITWEGFRERARRLLRQPAAAQAPKSFLPGPVAMRPEVEAAMARPAVSHRSAAFLAEVERTRRRLCEIVGAERVEVLLGSGTLGNDAVAAQLALSGRPGLVLVNGEFGERLADHARRAGLPFVVHAAEWGRPFEREQVARALASSRAAWSWAVHCETSTGVLNDLAMLKEVTAAAGAELALDGTSSVGTVPVDLSGIAFATSVSGKALGAFPGLSFVFHRGQVTPRPDRLPRYLDLGLYAASDGVPFTHSSNLWAALAAALDRPFEARYAALAELASWLRARLRELGFRLVAPEAHAAPGIVTIAPDPPATAEEMGERLEREGFLLSWRSGYLRRRNWLQIALMGEASRPDLEALLEALGRSTPISLQ